MNIEPRPYSHAGEEWQRKLLLMQPDEIGRLREIIRALLRNPPPEDVASIKIELNALGLRP